MRNAKSLTAVLVSVATLLGAVQAMPASAATNPRDVNGDGVVSAQDAVVIGRYLVGGYHVPNYNKLDVNGSLTVDQADVDCIWAYLSEQTYTAAYYSRKTGKAVDFPTTSGFTPDDYAASTASRIYMRYSYKEGRQLLNYTLSPTKETIPTSSGGLTPYAIIGDNDQYPAYSEEVTGIVKLSSGGTGFVVGEHQIATAAHCVYNKNPEVNDWIKSMTITIPDSNGSITAKTLTAVEAHFPTAFLGNSTAKYDYALITVEEDLSKYCVFSLGTTYNLDAAEVANIPIYVTGVLGSNGSSRVYSAEGRIVNANSAGGLAEMGYVLRHNADTQPGESGSPIYTITRNNKNGVVSYTYTVVGIHTGVASSTSNCGPRITKYQLQFFSSNTHASW